MKGLVMKNMNLRYVKSAMLLIVLLGLPLAAFAAGESAPWDGALCWLVGALKGKTALAVATIAFVAAAVGFVWGEQLTGIFKTMVNIFVAVCIMLGASSIVNIIASKVDSSYGQQCAQITTIVTNV
ncbi:TrbC/VirB2 family protein [Methylovorus glucosotrophus]|nr:TrbC/VirB2 family protein [Methylovorus glucosotrophus]